MESLGLGRRRGALASRCACAALLAGLAAAGAARPPIHDWRIEPFEWQGELGGARVLAVSNPYGDVRARRADGSSVAVFGALQRHRTDPREWKITIAPAGDRLAVTVVPGSAALAGAPLPADWQSRRVDLTIYVPAGAKLEVETTTGLIEAKRLGGDVEARSLSGEIVVTTTGSVDARSREGRIRYSFLDPAWVGRARLATRSGDIALTLPRGANVDLAIQTRGVISTGEALAPAARKSLRLLKTKLGGGGSPIAIESETGKVEVQQIRS